MIEELSSVILAKFILVVLYTQFGKTFFSINQIKEDIEKDKKEGKSITMVYAMNTLLANKQFCARLNEIEEKYGPGSVAIFSSEPIKKITTNGLMKY